jgi:hypothetical protein
MCFSALIGENIMDDRRGKNIQLPLLGLLRQFPTRGSASESCWPRSSSRAIIARQTTALIEAATAADQRRWWSGRQKSQRAWLMTIANSEKIRVKARAYFVFAISCSPARPRLTRMLTSTRRLLALPCGVLFEDTGRASPIAAGVNIRVRGMLPVLCR